MDVILISSLKCCLASYFTNPQMKPLSWVAPGLQEFTQDEEHSFISLTFGRRFDSSQERAQQPCPVLPEISTSSTSW